MRLLFAGGFIPGLLLAVAAWPQTAASPERDSLQPIPVPDAGQLGVDAQDQLVQARSSLDSLLGRSAVSESDLAEGYGLLGRLYYVYDFRDLAKVSFFNARQLVADDYRWSYYLAALYRLDGDWPMVVENLERVLATHPDDLSSLIRLGEARIELGEVAAAKAIYERVIGSAPEVAAGYAGRGRVAYEEGDYVQAIEDLSRALELQPGATSLHHRLGMAYRQEGDLERARFHLQSNKGDYLRFPDPLIHSLGSLVQSSQVYFNAGVEAARGQNWPEAIVQFRRAIEAVPGDSLAAYNLGLALQQNGERQEGMFWLSKSVELDPDFRNGHFNLATLYGEDGMWEQAVEHLRQAHRIDPEDREAHLELATALSQAGRETEAVAQLESLLTLHPRDPEGWLNLGTLQLRSGNRQEAARSFSRLLEVGGDPEVQVMAHLRLGSLLESDGRAGEALAHYQAAADLDPDSLEAQLQLASALGRTGQFDEAAAHFDQVVGLAPDRIDAHFGRAMALMLAETYPQALDALELSLSTHPGNVAIQHALARLLATCPDAAVRDGDRALILAEAVMQEESNLEHAQTLAMALAEVGRFEEAAALQSRVVTEAERLSHQQVASRARYRLDLYRSGTPSRAPWKGE